MQYVAYIPYIKQLPMAPVEKDRCLIFHSSIQDNSQHSVINTLHVKYMQVLPHPIDHDSS